MSLDQASWTHKFTEEQVAKWKKDHGQIWTTEIGQSEYVYRGMTNAEFEKLREEERLFVLQLEGSGKTQEEISQLTMTNSMKSIVLACLLYPENYTEALSSDLAGVLEVLQPAILEASGFPNEAPEIHAL